MKFDKKNRSSFWLIGFFALFILAFMIWDFLKPVEKFSEFENRYLKQRPLLTLNALMDNSYTGNYEGFINDQFVLRDEWINLKSKGEKFLLKVENNGILYGKNDMLFEKFNSLNNEQLEKNIGFLDEFLKDKQNTTFMIIPSAYEIYRENLPFGITMVNQQDEIAKLYSYFDKKTDVIDLYSPLKENKEDYIYYRTDHHWTTKGAYIAYQSYCEEKGKNPMPIDFSDAIEAQGFLGTYFNKSKNTSLISDTLIYFDMPIRATVNNEQKESYLDKESLNTRDKYSAFLYGNNALTVLSSDNEGEKSGKILVIKDSFSNCFVPFLTYNYEEVYVADLRSLPMGLTELIENTEFDDILVMYNFMNFQSDTNFYRLKY